jgi:hypothetical protein
VPLDHIQSEDFSQPASLTVWPCDLNTKAAQPKELSSLHDALKEAFAALRYNTGMPWIITAGGLILTPSALLDMMPVI